VKGFTRILLVGFMALGLAACGGSDDANSSARYGTTAASSADGIYQGDWKASDGNFGKILVAQMSHGKLYAFSMDGTIMKLNVVLTGSAVTATGRFDTSSDTKGTVYGDGTLKGANITMSLVRADGIHNEVTLTRARDSGDKSSFDLMTGEYRNANRPADYKLNAKGALSGSDAEGCTYSGDIDIIDPSINIYALNLNKNCSESNTQYEGFVSRVKSNGSLFVLYSDAEDLFVDVLTRY